MENTYIIINGVLLVVALKILGIKFLMKTIFAIFCLYFMLMIAQDIIPKQENGLPFKLMGEGQDFMSMIIGCVLTGIALATVFTNNGSTGGTDIIAASVNKYHPSVSLQRSSRRNSFDIRRIRPRLRLSVLPAVRPIHPPRLVVIRKLLIVNC